MKIWILCPSVTKRATKLQKFVFGLEIAEHLPLSLHLEEILNLISSGGDFKPKDTGSTVRGDAGRAVALLRKHKPSPLAGVPGVPLTAATLAFSPEFFAPAKLYL